MALVNVVPLKSSSMEADEHGLSDTLPPSKRATGFAKRRRSRGRSAAAILAEDDRYVSLAEAGELCGVSQETLPDASVEEPSPPQRVATTSSASCSATWQSCLR